MMLSQKNFRCAYSHSQMHEINLIQEIVDICALCFPNVGDFNPMEKHSSIANSVNKHAIVQNRKCDFYTHKWLH